MTDHEGHHAVMVEKGQRGPLADPSICPACGVLESSSETSPCPYCGKGPFAAPQYNRGELRIKFDPWSYKPSDLADLVDSVGPVFNPLGKGPVFFEKGEVQFRTRTLKSKQGDLAHHLRLALEPIVRVKAQWLSDAGGGDEMAAFTVDWYSGEATFISEPDEQVGWCAEFFEAIDGHLPEDSDVQASDLASQVASAKWEFEEALREQETRAVELKSALTSARQAVDAAKKVAEQAVLSHHAAVFSKEAKAATAVATRWLVFAAFSLVALAGVAVWFASSPPEGLGAIVARITLFSIPATTLGVALRQYSAARHNSVIAKHRANALSSYEAFQAAVGDGEAAKAMLAHAIGLVFSVQDTGYSKSASSSESTTIFAELIKQLGGSK